jgi:hypothetical protein
MGARLVSYVFDFKFLISFGFLGLNRMLSRKASRSIKFK